MSAPLVHEISSLCFFNSMYNTFLLHLACPAKFKTAPAFIMAQVCMNAIIHIFGYYECNFIRNN